MDLPRCCKNASRVAVVGGAKALKPPMNTGKDFGVSVGTVVGSDEHAAAFF